MNILDPKELQELVDNNCRILLYKEENDSTTPEPGPYRLQVFLYPAQPNSIRTTASGATLDLAIDDLNNGVDTPESLIKMLEEANGKNL